MVPVVSILLALGLPLLALWRRVRRPGLFSAASFAFCGWGMIEELRTIRRRFFAGDLAGIEDTIGAVILLCVLLLAGTIALNLLLVIAKKDTETK